MEWVLGWRNLRSCEETAWELEGGKHFVWVLDRIRAGRERLNQSGVEIGCDREENTRPDDGMG